MAISNEEKAALTELAIECLDIAQAAVATSFGGNGFFTKSEVTAAMVLSTGRIANTILESKLPKNVAHKL